MGEGNGRAVNLCANKETQRILDFEIDCILFLLNLSFVQRWLRGERGLLILGRVSRHNYRGRGITP